MGHDMSAWHDMSAAQYVCIFFAKYVRTYRVLFKKRDISCRADISCPHNVCMSSGSCLSLFILSDMGIVPLTRNPFSKTVRACMLYELILACTMYIYIVGLRPPPPPVVPTFFLLFSFTFLFEDFYYSVKEYKKISVCCSSG